MKDQEIIALYWKRDENAIKETKRKYEPYVFKIAQNILNDSRDSEECINDTYLKAWNSMPPHSPLHLSLYLAKITRECSIDRWRHKKSLKRRCSEYAHSLSEIEECIKTQTAGKEIIDLQLLKETIQSFLDSLSKEERCIFIERYYYMDPVTEIARHHAFSVSKTKSILYRIRNKLRQHLIKEGYDL